MTARGRILIVAEWIDITCADGAGPAPGIKPDCRRVPKLLQDCLRTGGWTESPATETCYAKYIGSRIRPLSFRAFDD